MQTLQHIKSLLYKYDTVIVPGFGAFQGSYASATVDKKQNLIYPPYKKLSYNEKLTFDDGKLLKEISETKKLSLEESEKILKEDVKLLFEKLNLDQSVRLDGIGTIRKNERGIYELDQDTSVNYLLDSYGLKAVELPRKTGIQTSNTVTEKIEKPVVEEKPVKTVVAEQTSKSEPVIEKDERVIIEEESSGWLWLLLPIILFGVGLLLWKFIFSDNDKATLLSEKKLPTVERSLTLNEDSIKQAELKAAERAAIADSIQAAEKVVKEEANNNTQTSTNNTSEKYTPPPRTPNPNATNLADRGYYMVISSTPKRVLADKKTEDLRSRNIKAETLAGPKNYWRTAIWLDANEASAKRRLSELKGSFPDGWLLKY